MTSRVIVAIRVSVSAARAFDAFTAEIGAWWKPAILFAPTPGPPGRLSFEPGAGGRLIETSTTGVAHEIGRVTEWSPPADGGSGRLAFGWRPASVPPEQATEVVVLFEPLGPTETRVTVEHLGWDRVPAKNAARHGFPLHATLARAADWWRAELASYKAGL